MTPKEKAKDLVDKFYMYGFPVQTDRLINLEYEMENAKQCALIAVDEILKATAIEKQVRYDNGEWSRTIETVYCDYWQEVQQEINKL